MRKISTLLAVALMATWGALNLGCAPAEAPPATPPATGTAPADGSGTSAVGSDAAMTKVAFNVEGMH